MIGRTVSIYRIPGRVRWATALRNFRIVALNVLWRGLTSTELRQCIESCNASSRAATKEQSRFVPLQRYTLVPENSGAMCPIWRAQLDAAVLDNELSSVGAEKSDLVKSGRLRGYLWKER